MWLSQGGPTAKKHRGASHPIAVFLIQYFVVAWSTTIIHDVTVPPGMPTEALAGSCVFSPQVANRQRIVSFMLAVYFMVYFAIRLLLARQTPTHLFCEFYRQTFLCSGTIANAALAFFTGRPVIAQAFCLAVGVDQLLWYVDLGWYFLRGSFPIGVTKYLFWPGTTWFSRITSTHHLWTIPLVMWATGGFAYPRALPLSCYVVAINVLLSRWMTPHWIEFPKETSGRRKDDDDMDENKKTKDVLYLNLNLAHEVWTDLNINFLLIGEGSVPYLLRLIMWWFCCNCLVFGFLYSVSFLIWWRSMC